MKGLRGVFSIPSMDRMVDLSDSSCATCPCNRNNRWQYEPEALIEEIRSREGIPGPDGLIPKPRRKSPSPSPGSRPLATASKRPASPIPAPAPAPVRKVAIAVAPAAPAAAVTAAGVAANSNSNSKPVVYSPPSEEGAVVFTAEQLSKMTVEQLLKQVQGKQ